MKNKKGFTLTELIVTIGLLALIGVVIITNMSGILEKNKDDNYANFVKAIEDAACTFIDLRVASNYVDVASCKNGSGCTILVQNLISEGLLSEKQAISPRTNASVAGNAIKIAYPNKKKTCTYQESD